MDELSILTTAILFKILTASLACFGVWLVTRILDKIGRINFAEVISEASAEFKVIYFCVRLIAYSYIFATVFTYG